MNFHGARSKTRVVENRSSKKQDIAPKSHGNDDGWGSVPKSTESASNWDDGWGDIPQESSTSENAWGQDRRHGKAERNHRFRSNNTSSTFRVPNQSRSNWDEVDEEFPSLGSRATPTVNVWEKRKEKFEQVKAIEPTNQTEEEMMIQKAIELSKMEVSREEERRRQLEEEYRLQTQLLEANPDMFEEFRLGEETYNAAADKFVAESYGASNGYSEESSNNRINKDSLEHVNGWDQASEITVKNKDLKKEKNNYESHEEDDTSQLKQDSRLPPTNTTAVKSSYSNTRPKISKVVDMFGGWGTAKPATVSNRDNVEDVSDHRSSKWDTVDVEFASRSSIRKTASVKPTNRLSSPVPPEVKINNTFSNWDTDEAETATKLSGWDSAEAETANKLSSLDINETATATKVSTWDTVETIDANLENASLTVTPEEENYCKVPSIKSDRQVDINKVTSKDDNWGSDSLERENFLKRSDNFELNSEHGYASYQNDKKLVSQSEQKNSKSKANFKTQSKDEYLLSEKDMKEMPVCFDKAVVSDLDNDQNIKINKHEFQLDRSELSCSISPEMSVRHAEVKAKIDSLEGKCFDSHSSVESDYAFLLNSIDSNFKGSTTVSKIPNRETKTPNEDLPSMSTSSYPKTKHTLEFPLMANQTSSFGLSEDDPCKNPPISGPHPLYTNYNEASSVSTFGAFPSQIDNCDLLLSRNGGSLIDPPKASVPTPELINPVFPLQPMMTPLMNPSLMMGMNPMLMQQMMMLSNPFFMQQWQQMAMYYKSLGMSLESGMPFYPQPMPLPNFANNPNAQVFGNLNENVGPIPATEDGMISPPFPAASSPPGINASHLFTGDPLEVEQPDDSFWFKSYLSSDSSLIPPPKPTLVSAHENLPGVTPESKISPTALASLPFGTTSMVVEGLSPVNSPIPGHQSYESSSRSPEVPYVTGWGDINVDCNSNEASGWCDDVDGWGSENASTARSMRNPSRHIAEKKTACRQPASRPNLGRSKK